MPPQLPESNAEIVAFNIVDHAVVDDLNTPGEAIALLLEKMAAISRDIGGDFRAGNADWRQMVDKGDDAEIKPTVDRIALAIGDTWAKRWILCMMTKHLSEALENSCLDSPASTVIESISYGQDGSIQSWTQRKKS